MSETVSVPRDLFVRLMAAIETPLDLDESDIDALLADANALLDRGMIPRTPEGGMNDESMERHTHTSGPVRLPAG